ncbi:hypothetical protein Tco_0787627, partial [Tanacetum coccineum]
IKESLIPNRFLSPRDITREGYSITSCVADVISNGAWNWPQAWLLKAPNLSSISIPNINASNDSMVSALHPSSFLPYVAGNAKES